jgi:hypothetical protein
MRNNVILKGMSLTCAGMLLAACEDADRTVAPIAPNAPLFTAAAGVTPTDFGPGGEMVRGTFEGFKLKRIATESRKRGWPHGRWEMDIQAEPSVDVVVRSFNYEPGGYTGWHTHPGPVFIQVIVGAVTFYQADDPDCAPVVVEAPGTFLDTGEHAHIGRNETSEFARDLVVLFAPEGAPLRHEADDPGHCPFAS